MIIAFMNFCQKFGSITAEIPPGFKEINIFSQLANHSNHNHHKHYTSIILHWCEIV